MAFLNSTHVATAHRSRSQNRGILATLMSWAALARQRRKLARLDDEALRDMGISRSDAEIEAMRAFWDAPHNWRL